MKKPWATLFNLFTLCCLSLNLAAQSDLYRLEYSPDKNELLCKRQRESGSDVVTLELALDQCHTRRDLLVTPMKYVRDESDRCLAFIDAPPFYFAGVIKDDSVCPAASGEQMDLSENFIKYAQDEVNITCMELGSCLEILARKDQGVVDDTIKILERIAIDSKLLQLRASIDQDRVNFVLPEFKSQLALLQRENEKCQNKFKYSDGDLFKAQVALAGDLNAISHVLENDLYMFHWYPGFASYLTTSEDGDSNLVARAHASMLQNNYFSWDGRFGTGMQGRGLYASPDPLATSNYGNILLKIRVPAGSRYLEVGGERDSSRQLIPLKSETVRALRQVGCNLSDTDRFQYREKENGDFEVVKYVFSSMKECRRVFNSVVENEGYIFQSYGYSKEGNAICDENFQQAFVLIQNEMSTENVRAFYDPFGKKKSEWNEEVKDLYDISSRGSLGVSPERLEDLKERYGDHLWKCNSDGN